MIAREKIQAAISNHPNSPINPSDARELTRTLTKAGGGYVHGASPHIMEMIMADGRFAVDGCVDYSYLVSSSERLSFRASTFFVLLSGFSMALGFEDLVDEISQVMSIIPNLTGIDSGIEINRKLKGIKMKGQCE